MKRILIAIILVLFISSLQFNRVDASTQGYTNLEDFKQFDSFMKRYHEHSADLMYFMSTSYNSNDHYFRENHQLFRNAVNSVYDSTWLNSLMDSSEELFAKPIALLGVSKDLRKSLWDKILNVFKTEPEEIIDSPYFTYGSLTVYPATGYELLATNIDNGNSVRVANFGYISFNSNYQWGYIRACTHNTATTCTNLSTKSKEVDVPYFSSITKQNVMSRLLNDFGISISIKKIDTGEIVGVKAPQQIQNIYNRTINNYNEGRRFDEDYTPKVSPYLACPSGNVNLNYDDGVWYTDSTPEQTSSRSFFMKKVSASSLVTIIINTDGKAIHNGENCDLDFKFPNIEIHVNGDVSADGESILRTPGSGSGVPPSEEMDDSILGYIREAYEFATKSINTGVEGLKSILLGTVGLVSIVTAFFDFLPPELLTLFVGGFSIALGLWVFKR